MPTRPRAIAAWVTCALCAAGAPAFAQDEPRTRLAPNDFAYSIELTSADGAPVQTVLVPLAVYRTALRPDLGDVRVFNAAGEPLPHAIRKLAPPLDPAHAERAPRRESLRVRGHASKEEGVFDYDLGGAFPVERLRVLLPSPGTSIQAEVSVAAAPGETEAPEKVSAIRARTSKRIYDDVFDGPIYRRSEGGTEIASPPIELSGRRVRYVSITVGEGATLADAPELDIDYAPAQLLFVPRAPAPYSLAYGSHVAGPSQLTAEALLSTFGGSLASLPPATAQLGATITLAGEAALRAPAPARTKTYVLWSALIAGTLAVTGLAVRLIRKLDA